MSILIPATTHVVTWVKQNQLDTTTYYVRAVIRDVRTDTILDTLNLTNLGSGRFSANWNVPQDASGFGTEISIDKTVYEDSGYTQVSGIYGTWQDNYLIYSLGRSGGSSNTGGFGSSVDYDYLARIIEKKIREAISEIPKPEPAQEIDFSKIVGELDGVKRSFADRIKELFNISKKVENIEKIERDISSLTKEISNINKSFRGAMDDHVAKKETIMNKITEECTNMIDEFSEIADGQKKSMADLKSTLERPLKIQRVEEFTVVADKEKGNRADVIKRML